MTQGGWSNQTGTRLVLVVGPPFTGIFFYDPVIGPGDLFLSITPSAGTDPYGNTYPQGITVGKAPGAQVVIGETGGSPLIYFPTGNAGIHNSTGLQTITQGAGAAEWDLFQILGAENTVQNDFVLSTWGSSSTDGTQKAQATTQYRDSGGVFHILISATSAGVAIPTQLLQAFTADLPMLVQTDTVSSGNGFIKQTHAAAGSTALRILVTGDTNDRYNLNANGTAHYGPGNAATDVFLQRAGASTLAISPNALVGTTTVLGDNGIGEIQLANATTTATTNPTGGGILQAKQSVPTWRDSGGQLLGLVRSYSADATSSLASFTAETDVPGATVSVVVTGSNATVIVAAQFDMEIGTTVGTTMIGFLTWNGADRTEQVVMIAPAILARNCLSRTWRITGVTAGTYIAKLRASCTTSAANNAVESPHTGLTVMVIDQ